MATTELDSLDLAALLCSRVCHDVISPVGAILNGLEVLDEEKDESMRDFALDLVRKSAQQASARLQFARIAFGAAGSAGAAIDMADAEKVARGFVGDDKVKLSWTGPRALVPKNRVKLLLNLIVVALHAIPRGGSLAITVSGEPDSCSFDLLARGAQARVPSGVPDLLAGRIENHVDAHAIQPYYTGAIARAARMTVQVAQEGDDIRISAATAG
jgi:histidine phosphotransferase ChpT